MTTTEDAPAPSDTANPYPDTGRAPRPDLHPIGVNHLAISTADMKAQLTFFADVLGCPTKALYWMHGVDDAFHGFVELSPESYIAFVYSSRNPTAVEWGVTHAGNAGNPLTAGAMQHLALHVGDLDELLTMRDRIRSRGVQVLGPIDHGFCQSIYFAGPENLALEIATGRAIDERQWVDPEVQGLCGISDDEMARLVDPDRFERPDDAIAQPPYDETKPNLRYPDATREAIFGMPDEQVWNRISFTDPPVPLD